MGTYTRASTLTNSSTFAALLGDRSRPPPKCNLASSQHCGAPTTSGCTPPPQQTYGLKAEPAKQAVVWTTSDYEPMLQRRADHGLVPGFLPFIALGLHRSMRPKPAEQTHRRPDRQKINSMPTYHCKRVRVVYLLPLALVTRLVQCRLAKGRVSP